MLPLLAKSVARGKEIPEAATLPGHLLQTIEVAELIVDILGERIVRATGCNADLQDVSRVLRVSAVCHDIGKASQQFQDMIYNPGTKPNVILRHELISFWLLNNPEVGLKGAVGKLFAGSIGYQRWGSIAIATAIAGHHLKFTEGRFKGTFHNETVDIAWDHPDFLRVQNILEKTLETHLELTVRPKINLHHDWMRTNIADPLFAVIRDKGQDLDPLERNLCALLRGLLMSADMLGSVVSPSREEWLERYLPNIRQAISNRNLSMMLKNLIQEAAGNFLKENLEITAFQDKVANSVADITLAEAGCGSGKTIAAYRWAENTGRPFLIMMYPTTATATQGFSDYAFPLGSEAQLLHSRSVVDMELFPMETDPEEAHSSSQYGQEATYQALARLEHPLTVCTVDTVLGILQNYRSSMLMLPVLLQSALVFDEIHSYDEKLFKHMLGFIDTFRIPVLLMTASLQPERREVLEKIMVKRNSCEVKEGICSVKGPAAKESLPRYFLKVVESLPVETVQDALHTGKKVLIVCNTVNRAVNTYQELACQPEMRNWPFYVCHSHFKYIDRFTRQQEIVKAFKNPGPCCVITTQICEMSFDVSADFLFSEIAPFASIIQRMGRLNRYAGEETPLGQADFWITESPRPYKIDELQLCKQLLERLSNEQSVSQILLAEYQTKFADGIWTKRRPELSWLELDSAVRGQTMRDIGMTTMNYMLYSDYEAVYRQWPDQPASEMMKYILPLPNRPTDTEIISRWKHVRIVDDQLVDYSFELGGRWK